MMCCEIRHYFMGFGGIGRRIAEVVRVGWEEDIGTQVREVLRYYIHPF